MLVRSFTLLLSVVSVLSACDGGSTISTIPIPDVATTDLSGDGGDTTVDDSTVGDSTVGDSTVDDTGEPDTGSADDVPPPDDVDDTDETREPDATVPEDVPELPDGAACFPGSGFCDGQNLYYCLADGSGYLGKKCNTECKDGKCTGEQVVCKPKALFCDKANNRLLSCDESGQSATFVQICEFGCNELTADCKSETDCTKGEKRCKPGADAVEVCDASETKWLPVESCATGCFDGACLPPACQKGEKTCGSNKVLTCNDKGTDFVETEQCPYGCVVADDGATCANCKPGSFACDVYTVTECKKAPGGNYSFDYVEECELVDTCAGGKCIPMLYLDGTPQNAMFYLAESFLACIGTGVIGPCAGLYTVDLQTSFSLDDMRSWACDDAGPSGFSEDDVVTLKDLFGCGTLDQIEVAFKAGVTAGVDGLECFKYTGGGGFVSDDIVVDQCKNL
ncbi:MAG: hypothetical protein IV100_28710 [Myxococcales bacterium]|nr:hypothetical protein [Myxococcales bacterium]